MSSGRKGICEPCDGKDGSDPVKKYLGAIILGGCLVVALIVFAVMRSLRERGHRFYR